MTAPRTRPFGEIQNKPPVDIGTVRMVRVKPEKELFIGPIEDGRPIPVQGGRQKNQVTQALLELSVDQSRFFKGITRAQATGYAYVAQDGTEKQRRKYRCFTEGEGVRVFRVA